MGLVTAWHPFYIHDVDDDVDVVHDAVNDDAMSLVPGHPLYIH